eukprot:6062972-Pyramimonas_sp.AAC.1
MLPDTHPYWWLPPELGALNRFGCSEIPLLAKRPNVLDSRSEPFLPNACAQRAWHTQRAWQPFYFAACGVFV